MPASGDLKSGDSLFFTPPLLTWWPVRETGRLVSYPGELACMSVNLESKDGAVWWEQSPSSNVAPEFEYRRCSHIRVLRFSSLLKNHPYFQITIRSGTHGHLDLLCFMGEQITIFLTLFKVKRTCLDRFSSSPAPLGVLQYPVTILKVTTSDKCCDNLNQCRYNVAMQCCAKIIPCTGLLRYFLTLINNWGRTEDRYHYCEEWNHKPSS